MFSKFIRRPVFAIVISVVIVFVGILAIKKLPISQFPDIAPTTVNIFIAYPGASADVLVKSTLIMLEQAINGVQDIAVYRYRCNECRRSYTTHYL